jgi:hypothetical protein
MRRLRYLVGCVVGLGLALCFTPVGRAQQAQTAMQAEKNAKESLAQKPAEGATAPSTAEAATPSKPEEIHVRDPFAPLVHVGETGGHVNLPPGIAGLQIATMRLQGMVKGTEGMVAVVANPQDRVYFLHEGDHVYDGVVEKIGLDQITFKQESKDAFGRSVEREVTKRLYPIAGDEQ